MAISPYAIVSLDELKSKLFLQGDNVNAQLERIINQASSDIETHLDRQIVTRGSLVEYHTPTNSMCEIYPGEWPIIAISEVCEDTATPRTYAASTILVADTDYEMVRSPASKLRRLSSGELWYWWPGRRTVRVTYTAGYTLTVATPQTTPLVPEHIRGVCFDLCALYYKTDDRKQYGVSGASDATGNWQRFAPSQLTDDMKMRLSSERREPFPGTWERAA